ncbi:IS110 family transposase [Bradyrhizobium sp. CCBAU 45394]|uniref:IS110 family transposase n=1 Tax=Bradyrhizobium sp. CCBAU 45394 TaxID=1325087 RepID=UPI0023027AF4|nr:IS110 family transposase [Bradyrhizobium sp. CCBAU 45394]
MSEVSIIGLDLAKNVFQMHGADGSGTVLFRKKLRRDQVLKYLAAQPTCTLAMEACASSHYWGRQIGRLGHAVRLIAPDYVKPFVKRQKNDAADAEAICEAAQRPTMRFVAVKSEEQQAAAIVFRARDLLVRQRTQTINALRGHLTEFGVVAAQGPSHVAKLVSVIISHDTDIPELARPILRLLVEQLRSLNEKVALLDRELARRAKEDAEAKRLMAIQELGRSRLRRSLPWRRQPRPSRGERLCGMAGAYPLQRSTGGKQKLGKTSRMGERTLRRLLIIGASAAVRWAMCKGSTADPWLARMLALKPPMLVIVALANKMARIVWALMARGATYRAPAAVK